VISHLCLFIKPYGKVLWRTKRETNKILTWTKAAKRVLLIAASILAARKLAQFDGCKRVPATISATADAVRWSEEIMNAIDNRFPTGTTR
jgi:hypothetical protein